MHPGIQSWKNLVVYAYNAFSTPLLLRTLFSPWKMDSGKDSDLTLFERIVFSLLSRVIGFVARVVLIFIGLIFTIIIICTFPIFLLIPLNISREGLQNLGSIGASLSYGSTYFLNKHGHDVMSPSNLDIYGKEKVIRMVERGLNKSTNHNILLVGEPGVGKSVIIYRLGRLAQSGLSFSAIRNRRMVELELEGMSVEDLDKTMNEAASAHNIIIVLEGIHAFPQIFERLLKYLAMPHLCVIATTDFSEYDQVLKAHPEFLSKFEKIDVDPPNAEETLEIIKNSAKLNKLKIDEEALKEVITLTDRYIANQVQPVKSLLVLEELETLNKRITVDDVRQIVSDKTNIPIGVPGESERKVLLELEESMKEKIVGQAEAVKDVSDALKRLRTGISDPTKPAGSFLFLGPTGVGKTHTAKILAESYFGRKDSMIRFDMSEFSLSNSIETFSERLASVIEENPLSLVFFDELEKSDRAIHHLLLQVLDEGHLTRGNGRVASFKEAIIIATSNAGSAKIIENTSISKKDLISYLIENDLFAPEFLNRFSSVILFKPLTSDEERQVARLMLNELKDRLFADKKINLIITDPLIDKIVSVGFDAEFGARPIKRAIEEIVENKIADFIMAGNTGGDLKIL